MEKYRRNGWQLAGGLPNRLAWSRPRSTSAGQDRPRARSESDLMARGAAGSGGAT